MVLSAGHDDALAMLLAGYHPDMQLLGVSTVASNQVCLLVCTRRNSHVMGCMH